MAVAVVLLLLIGWAATHRTGSESDRHQASVSALRAAGIRQARVDVEGMEVTVYGVADDRHMREMALREVRDVRGVRMVTDRIVIGQDDGEPGLSPDVAHVETGPPTLKAPTAAPPPPAVSPSPAPAARTPAPVPQQARREAPAARPETGPAGDAEPCARAPAALQGVNLSFVSGSATLAGSSVNALSAVSSHLQSCPEALLEVRAFATEAPDAGANLTLSRQRANAVVGHLSRAGVQTHRLVATYRGDRAPGGDRAILTIHAGGAR